MKLYWRYKKDGKWTWTPAKWEHVKNLEPVAEIYAGARSSVDVKLYEKEEEE